jgi:hypothetical protein
MGFKMLPFSYCQWDGKNNRVGIRDMDVVKELVSREDFVEIFDDLDTFIKK